MNIIVAVDKNWAIGLQNRLLVSIPQDMKFFRETTTGKTVVMGRKTLESFPGGQPLKKRTNIVLTGKKDYQVKDAVICHSVEEVLKEAGNYESDDIYVIGGESIYRELLPYCDKDPQWEMTKISEEQTYFDLEYVFTVYERKGK